ncbi:MAG TPA: pyridoxamine 5'-phosphate oxidase [Bryobacteraceae bacterium]|jgi:pyridoxamine 5'-phosphate oxidase|nr:pyridoxamine 5'-phosphate oxidase [Bryobacteraceae bacterium]
MTDTPPFTHDELEPRRGVAAETHRLSLANLRENYTRGGLNESEIDGNPIVQFERWLQQALAADLREPNAMTLATVTPEGKPSARIVLLKEVSESGFVFYTNYMSRKGRDLETNPWAALIFYWADLERQVRVEGDVARVPRRQSEAYFQSRPKGSRLGAWASRQSQPVDSRAQLEIRLKDLEARYASSDFVPTPEFWGGYVVRPQVIEFWQGRPNRLHDRIEYRRKGETDWQIQRLSP